MATRLELHGAPTRRVVAADPRAAPAPTRHIDAAHVPRRPPVWWPLAVLAGLVLLAPFALAAHGARTIRLAWACCALSVAAHAMYQLAADGRLPRLPLYLLAAATALCWTAGAVSLRGALRRAIEDP